MTTFDAPEGEEPVTLNLASKEKGEAWVNGQSGVLYNFILLSVCQTTFDAPEGEEPVTLNLASKEKGEARVNGQSIGRYWISFLTKSGVPSHSWYHTPGSYLKSVEITLVY